MDSNRARSFIKKFSNLKEMIDCYVQLAPHQFSITISPSPEGSSKPLRNDVRVSSVMGKAAFASRHSNIEQPCFCDHSRTLQCSF